MAMFLRASVAAWNKQTGSQEENMDKKGKKGQIGISEDEWNPHQPLTIPSPQPRCAGVF